MEAPRSFDRRVTDSLAILSAPAADAWVATASRDGRAYLAPLSIGWTGEIIVLVTATESTTARNLSATSRSRLALGGTRDVVMIDARVRDQFRLAAASPPSIEVFVEQSGWDPRDDPDPDSYTVFELLPIRLQAWREVNELADRTLMRDGAWLDPSERAG